MDKQVVVITGASAGVGHATARVGRQQARVVCSFMAISPSRGKN